MNFKVVCDSVTCWEKRDAAMQKKCRGTRFRKPLSEL